MNKEDMITILNQYGIDGIFDSCDLIEPDNCDNNLDAKLLS